MRAIKRFSAQLMFILLMSTTLVTEASEKFLEKITLQLRWHHQFQFAGYYAAKEKGYYQDAGLDVHFVEGSPQIDVTQEVLSGRADYGTGTSELILSRYNGAPFVVLGVIFQHSPLNLVTLKSSGLDSIAKLENKKIMIEPGSAELIAFLQKEGLTSTQFTQVLLSTELDDLINGKVDAMLIYETDETYALKTKHIDYNQFSPSTSGIDFYGDNLFTTEQTIKLKPQQVEAFRTASIKGWQYAMTHQEEIVQLIYNTYTHQHSIDHLRFESKVMHQLMNPELITPGYMTLERWQQIAGSYQRLGLLPSQFNVNDLLYLPNTLIPQPQPQQVVVTTFALAIMTLMAFVLGLISLRKRQQAEYFKGLFQHAPASMIVLNINATILQWNNKAAEMFGWSSNEAIGQNAMALLVPQDNTVEHSHTVLHNLQASNTAIQTEHMNIRKNGQIFLCRWINMPLSINTKGEKHILAIATDISSGKQERTQIAQLAYFDALTGLPNRVLFFDRLGQMIVMAKRAHKQFALLFIELEIDNEPYSHQNLIVSHSAQRMQAYIRSSDTLARIKAHEFALLLTTDIEDPQDVQRVTNAIRNTLSEALIINEQDPISMSYRIGTAIYPQDGSDSESLSRHADLAMHHNEK